MTKEIDDHSSEKRMPMQLRFSQEAQEYMEKIGPTRQFWLAETLDADGMAQAVKDIYETKGQVTEVDARTCFDSWTQEFSLPEVEGGLVILTHFDELVFGNPKVDMWWQMREAGNKFAENKNNAMFIPHHPELSRRPGPAWMADAIRWHAFSDEPIDENLMSVANSSPSFSEAWGSGVKVEQWIREKWFGSIERESPAVKQIIWEVVKKLSVGREPMRDDEFYRVMKEVIPEIAKKYKLPSPLQNYSENLKKEKVGGEMMEIRQWLVDLAMIRWRDGGWRIHPAIKLPMETLFAYKDLDGYKEEVNKFMDMYLQYSVSFPRVSGFFLEQVDGMDRHSEWVKDSVEHFFGKPKI